MTQNPFDALGGGGLDLNALMQQAQQMQEQLQAAQRELEDASIDGSVAGGAVTVTVSGTGELTNVTIAPSAVDAADPDSVAELGDLVVAAYRDARAKADQLAQEQMGSLTDGLPGGMPGLPGQPGSSDPSDPHSGGSPIGFQ